MNRTAIVGLLVATLLGVACDHSRGSRRDGPSPVEDPPGPDDSPAAPAATDDDPAPETPTAVKLADAPTIDLVDNRYRWHLYRDGLVVGFAAEGFRKYTQEYRRPFGPVVEHDGGRGRVLERRAATLRIPWEGGEKATARIWVHGLAGGQRIQIDVNGHRGDAVAVPAEWTQVLVPITGLRDGENELQLHARKSGRARGERSHALWYAMEIVDGAAEPAGDRPAVTPVADGKLGGFSRMRIWTEIPRTAWLTVETIATDQPTRFRVRAQTFDSEPTTLLDTTLEAGESSDHQVDMSDFAGRLVALDFESTGSWSAPRIALEEAPVSQRPEPFQNVILLVVDAMRADRLALYGETRVQTPRMTEAGEHAVVFLNNQAASPSSPPSHGSIQTGMIPRVHGVVGDRAKLDAGTPMISTQLGSEGIATGYYGNNPFGMGRLETPGKWTAFHQPNKEGKGIDCTVLIDEMLGFAREQNGEGKRFFISSLPYEPHTPYRYHEGISDKYHDGPWGPPVGKSVDGYLLNDVVNGSKTLDEDEWAQLRALYDGEVEHMDQCFGQLVDGLKTAGLDDDTAIVLTSDHGEGMFEHGRMGHAFGHYSELANVPLVLYADGFVDDGPRRIDTVTNHIDIAPTVLDLMGVEPSDEIQGRSVLPLALRQGPWTPRVVSLEYGKSYALRSLRWKMIVEYDGTESLFDLQSDPTEQTDLIEKNDFALRYLRDLAGFFLEHRSDWHTSRWGTLGDHDEGFVEAVTSED